MYPIVRLAAVQAAPVWLEREATIAKACALVEEASAQGAQVIGFPESFLPGYPHWYNWCLPLSRESVEFQMRLFKNAIDISTPVLDPLKSAARRAKAFVVIGASERLSGTMGTLYNSLLFIGPDGNLRGAHRKLVPTVFERLVHTSGDGSSLRTYETPHGAVGGLICGENTNSLARFALLAQQERIHVASWPAFTAGQRKFNPIDIRARYHALEGRVFVISACGVLDDPTLDAMGLNAEQRGQLSSRGGHSGIIGPDGEYVVGPVDDSPQIVYADADYEKIIEGKLTHDVTGHYNRFDVFTLTLRTSGGKALVKYDEEHNVGGAAESNSDVRDEGDANLTEHSHNEPRIEASPKSTGRAPGLISE